jgi:hypothetical protein
MATAILAGLAVLLVACGGDDGIRISAITATPGTATPTPADASETVQLEEQQPAVPLPDPPENPFAGGRLVEAYLAGGSAHMEDCLPELVLAWRLAPSVDGPRCVFADLDGDRRDEWVFLISYGTGADDESPYAADAWFFQDEAEGYRFFNSARALANAATAGLRIRLVRDLTSDGQAEVVMSWLDCSTEACTTRLIIASYNNGILENLAPSEAAVAALEEFEVDGNTIRMSGAATATAETGPRRPTTTVVRWAGARFRAEVEQGEAAYLVHAVNDADRLFAQGAYAEARDAYLAISTNTALPDWHAEVGRGDGRAVLQAYALFRAGVASFRLGQEQAAIDQFVAVIERFPGSHHDIATQAYLVAALETGSPDAGCAAAETSLNPFASQYRASLDYGSANPERTIFTLCR